MDALSAVLSLLKPSSHGFRGLDAGPSWRLDYPAWGGLKCYAVRTGTLLLWVDGQPGPLQLGAGDAVLLAGGQAYRMGSAADLPPRDARAFFAAVPPGEVAVLDGGGHASGFGGYFAFANPLADRLLAGLPPVIRFEAGAGALALQGAVARLMAELRDPQPGGALMAGHLAQALLVEALRQHLRAAPDRRTGWIFALADPQLSRALEAMHADPARRWTLDALARCAGQSRSTFAARFKAVVGEPAMVYLTRWRMLLAADRMLTARVPLATLAQELGYGSESAFSAAFKRVAHCAPRRFVQERTRAGG